MKLELKKKVHYFIVSFLLIFGLLTLFLSSSVIFDLFGFRAKEGNYVLFIVVSNFICSMLYLFAVYGFITNRKWTTNVLTISLIVLLIGFMGLTIHIVSGGIYETKTIGAMIFRISLTVFFVAYSFLLNKRIKNES